MDDATLLVWLDRGRTLAYLLVAVGVVGEFLVDRISAPAIKRRDDAQHAEIARLNKEAGDARQAASGAMEQIAKAHEETAKASAQAAAANERAAKLERDGAELKAEAEKERLARVQIEEKLAPRQISPAQEVKLLETLKPILGRQIIVFFITGNPETERFARALAAVLTKAGLQVETRPGMMFGGSESGISLMIGKNRIADAGVLADALVEAQIAPKPIPAEKMKQEDDTLQVVIAPK